MKPSGDSESHSMISGRLETKLVTETFERIETKLDNWDIGDKEKKRKIGKLETRMTEIARSKIPIHSFPETHPPLPKEVNKIVHKQCMSTPLEHL